MLGENEDFLDGLTEDLLLDLGFSDGGDNADADFSPKLARVRRFKAPRCARYEHAVEAARDVGLLAKGDHVDMIVSGNFIAGDFLEAYLAENGLMAQEMIISTLSMSRDNVDSLRNIQLSTLAGSMGLIISSYFFANERRAGIEDIIKQLGQDPRFFFAAAGIHTKITLIRTVCGMALTFGGSANLRSSRNIEQITIDNDEAIYQHHRAWMAEILNNYHVTHTMLRRERLWTLVAKKEVARKPSKDGGPQS